MAKIRPTLEHHALREHEYYVLSILGVQDNRTLAELQELVAYAGREVTAELAVELMERGFVTYERDKGRAGTVRLTERGRRTIVELVALSKAVEADALQRIERSESQMLKHLLKRLIRNAVDELPPLWRRLD